MNDEQIQSKIASAIIAVEPRLASQRFDAQTTLSDLGIDSLKLIEVGVILEEAFGLSVHFDHWLDQERSRNDAAFSFGSLASYIQRATMR